MTRDQDEFITFSKFINTFEHSIGNLTKDRFQEYINYYTDELYKLQEKGLIYKSHVLD